MSDVGITPPAFAGERQVHEPHKVGIPPIGPYLRTLWQRRDFAFELSRTNLRAQHFNTVFGQLWLIINPLLLALVYFLLVDILRGGSRGSDFLAHLIAALFAYYFVNTSMTTAVRSVVSGGKLILNTAFPRLLMPFSAVRTAFFRFLPTLPVYALFHVIAGLGFHWSMVLSLYFLGLLIVFALGVAAFFAAIQVYFRDTTSFLPYFNRIWLYASPVLWSIEQVPTNFSHVVTAMQYVNPLHSLLGGFAECLVNGDVPELRTWVTATVWAGAVFAIGSLFFMSREREFAVRL